MFKHFENISWQSRVVGTYGARDLVPLALHIIFRTFIYVETHIHYNFFYIIKSMFFSTRHTNNNYCTL